MPTVLRRLVLIVTLMFWQGGFMFYGSVVVPIGTSVLGSDIEQGFITRAVTHYLNMAGAVALAAWAVDLSFGPRWCFRLRWLLWCFLAVALVLLAFLHAQMDGLLDVENRRVLDRGTFRILHSWYLSSARPSGP